MSEPCALCAARSGVLDLARACCWVRLINAARGRAERGWWLERCRRRYGDDMARAVEAAVREQWEKPSA
jgi:hypothetical protein